MYLRGDPALVGRTDGTTNICLLFFDIRKRLHEKKRPIQQSFHYIVCFICSKNFAPQNYCFFPQNSCVCQKKAVPLQPIMGKALRNLWYNYRSEVVFGAVMVAVVVLSSYLARFIPDTVYDTVLTPLFNIATFTAAFACAWIVFRHTENIRIRRMWCLALLTWGLGDLSYLICYLIAPLQLMNIGAEHITGYELFFGNLLGWVMVLYPTETLRPSWLTWRVVLWQLVPMTALVALDYVVPFSLRLLIALYPYALLALVLTHIRKYRRWCEDNFSTLDNMDVQWIIRYCIMLVIIGLNYVYICIESGHTRAFTQQWFVILMLVYSTEQILYRKDPWQRLRTTAQEEETADSEQPYAVYRETLEAWLEQEKPYCNPDFQLTDLRQVLPLNRTYLSQLINTEYGCSFYQWVNRLRIEEAKRLKAEHPELTLQDIAERCGLSSRQTFSRTFLRETGQTPSEWWSTQNSSK